MNIKKIITDDLRHMEDKEGLILQGCGGDPKEWVDGINQMFTEKGILLEGTEFTEVSVFEHDGLSCILYPFEDVKLGMGKLAMWRLQTHDIWGYFPYQRLCRQALIGSDSRPPHPKAE